MATMLELGRRFGGLAFTCERDFERVGAWVRLTAEPEWQIRFADHCHRFAFHADRLRWLVPAIAGLAVVDQIGPLDDLAAVVALDQASATTDDRVVVLLGQWRALGADYERLLHAANPVSDGPAIRWLRVLAADADEALASLAPPT